MLGAPPSAAALPPVSATGLGLPRPYAAYAAGPGSIVLQHDLRSGLARKQENAISSQDINHLVMINKQTFVFVNYCSRVPLVNGGRILQQVVPGGHPGRGSGGPANAGLKRGGNIPHKNDLFNY
jgi:hypothetical protein